MRGWGKAAAPPARLEIAGVSDDCIEDLRAAFQLFNANDEHGISPGEIVEAVRSVGLHQKNPMFLEYLLSVSARCEGEPLTCDEYTIALTDAIKEAWQLWREQDLATMFRMMSSSGVDDTVTLGDLCDLAKECGDTPKLWELVEMMDVARSSVETSAPAVWEKSQQPVTLFEFLNFIATEGDSKLASVV